MGNLVSGAVNWPFLNEPIWRWGLFTGVMLLFLFAWSGVLRHM